MSMSFPTIYKKDTGEIVQTGMIWCEDDMIEVNFNARLTYYGAETHSIINAEANGDTQYVAFLGEQNLVIDRPPVPYQIDKTVITADGDDFCTITGLHNPCEVVVDDPDPLVETTITTVTGGSFEFAAEAAGTYTIEISRFPFLPMTLEITAVDPQNLEAAYSTEFSSEFS